jgi:hypothetical protein
MKRILLLGMSVFMANGLFGAVKEADWATFEYPDEWNYRDPANKGFDVKVTLKEGAPLKEGVWLQPHLHWMRLMGYGGFQQWANPVKKPEVGKTYTFHYNPKVEEDEVNRYAFCIFLSPNGSDKGKIKEQWIDIKIPPPPPYEAKPADCFFKKSFIRIDEQPAPAKVGDEVVLKVRYYLDPSETWGPKQSKLSVTPLGPWIDNPDGVINKSRTHVSYGGSMFTKEKRIEPGDHVVEFKFELGTAYRYNSCFFLCKFKQPDGKDWPWDYRGGSLTVSPTIDVFRMYPTARGGMFFYDETPCVALLWGDRATHGLTDGKAVVKDVNNRVVLTKDVPLNPARRVQVISFPELKARGIFSLTVSAPGKGKDGADFEDFCYFGRIPRFQRIDGRLTPFGVTNIGDRDLSGLAYDLGFSTVRHFTSWSGIEPMRGQYVLEGLDAKVANNVAAGLKPWFQIHGPPAWSLPPEMGRTGEFEPAPFELGAWGKLFDTLAKRYKGKLYGFEFMNEIVPGKACKDPVKEYVDICRTAYEAVKKNDPSLVCQLAGGLWPHSYRIDLLNAGVAKYIDVLPVHYSTFEGVREAQNDLAVRGITNVKVADNETAKGYSIWNYPPDMAFEKSLVQCRHVMTRWPDELSAGAEFITYFGGGADACGNWSYMLDFSSPRPVAATLAVVQDTLAYAKPIGKFHVGETVCHLFEKDGKSILFLSTPGQENVKVAVPAKGPLAVTDFQGNETAVAGNEVATGDMPVIVSGGDLDRLKLHAALFVGTAPAPTALPQHVADVESITLPVTVSNPYADRRTFTVTGENPAWGATKPETVTLEPGASKTFELAYAAKGNAAGATRIGIAIKADGLDAVVKPCVLFVTDSASLGNLTPNGTFDGDMKPWKGEGRQATFAIPGDGANTVLEIPGKGRGYNHFTARAKLPVPGGTYLYSAWVRGEDMGGGSNLDEYDAAGKHLRNYMMLNVFTIPGKGTKGWNYVSKTVTVRPNADALALTPVAEGKEGARILYDNIQLSLYKGCNYVAFASGDAKAATRVPLLCENQVRADDGYEWSERNLAGVATFTWDKQALVFDVKVEDDVLNAKAAVSEDGLETLKGDAIALAIFPRMGPDGRPENEQLRWYVSKASPGGGSGATTVYRPKKYAMGAKSGQLCKDSSVYQIDIRREGTLTTYRLTIPWSEIPGFAPAKGASFGCNLVLTDSDGTDAGARMTWGGGLKDDSADCGLVTLLP